MNNLTYPRIVGKSTGFLIMISLLFLFLFCFEKAYGGGCCDEDVRYCPGYQEPDKPDPPRPDPSPPAPAPTNEPTVISEPSRPDPTPTEPTGPSPVSTDERPSISNPGLPEGKEGREEVKQSICEEWVKGLWFLKKCVRWR